MNQQLPEVAKQLCAVLNAPARLVAHVALVHDAAFELLQGLATQFPNLQIDHNSVLVGASIHDLGKILHPSELSGPGHRHEEDGPALLERNGIPGQLARFARTHATWDREPVEVEDLLVALADKVWKGQRHELLEGLVVERIASTTGIDKWQVFSSLDEILTTIAETGDQRLEWQQQFGTK